MKRCCDFKSTKKDTQIHEKFLLQLVLIFKYERAFESITTFFLHQCEIKCHQIAQGAADRITCIRSFA